MEQAEHSGGDKECQTGLRVVTGGNCVKQHDHTGVEKRESQTGVHAITGGNWAEQEEHWRGGECKTGVRVVTGGIGEMRNA